MVRLIDVYVHTLDDIIQYRYQYAIYEHGWQTIKATRQLSRRLIITHFIQTAIMSGQFNNARAWSVIHQEVLK